MTFITDDNLLVMLKNNLEIITDYMDAEAAEAKSNELMVYINAAKEFIQREGITIVDTVGDALLIVMYAAWLYERRKSADSYGIMPRMLRWNLNNRLFSEHVSGTPEVIADE